MGCGASDRAFWRARTPEGLLVLLAAAALGRQRAPPERPDRRFAKTEPVWAQNARSRARRRSRRVLGLERPQIARSGEFNVTDTLAPCASRERRESTCGFVRASVPCGRPPYLTARMSNNVAIAITASASGGFALLGVGLSDVLAGRRQDRATRTEAALELARTEPLIWNAPWIELRTELQRQQTRMAVAGVPKTLSTHSGRSPRRAGATHATAMRRRPGRRRASPMCCLTPASKSTRLLEPICSANRGVTCGLCIRCSQRFPCKHGVFGGAAHGVRHARQRAASPPADSPGRGPHSRTDPVECIRATRRSSLEHAT